MSDQAHVRSGSCRSQIRLIRLMSDQAHVAARSGTCPVLELQIWMSRAGQNHSPVHVYNVNVWKVWARAALYVRENTMHSTVMATPKIEACVCNWCEVNYGALRWWYWCRTHVCWVVGFSAAREEWGWISVLCVCEGQNVWLQTTRSERKKYIAQVETPFQHQRKHNYADRAISSTHYNKNV